MKQRVKQDINFLEKPLWVVDDFLFTRSTRKRGRHEVLTYIWETGDYLYESVLGAPTKFDGIILLYLLMQSQDKNWSETITSSLYQIMKNCGLNLGRRTYDRVKDSLLLWKNVTVHFKNSFRTKKVVNEGSMMIGNFNELHFNIIDYWGDLAGKKNTVEIRLSPLWLEAIRISQYYKLLNFSEYKKLTSPIAARLYEILIKSFEGRKIWKVGAHKLAEKITMKDRYASEIERKIKAAMNQINQKTELKILLKCKKPERGKCIFTFRKVSMEPEKDFPIIPGTILDKISKVYQKDVDLISEISTCLESHDKEYVIRNIEYANKNAKDNYPKYLKDALKNSWAPEQMDLFKDCKNQDQQRQQEQEYEQKQAEERNGHLRSLVDGLTSQQDAELIKYITENGNSFQTRSSRSIGIAKVSFIENFLKKV